MMRNWMIVVAPLALAMTSGCSGDHDGGSDAKREARSANPGPAMTKTYALSGFTGVEVAGPDDVTIRQGDAFAVSAKGPQAEIDALEIKLDGQTLSIGRKREGFSFGGGDHDGVEIAITMPALGAVRLTGSGSIDADSVAGDAVEAALTGSGDLKIARMTGKSADIAVSGSGDIEIAGGTVGMAEVSVTGSGDVDVGGLAVTTIAVSVTGSGNVEAQATGKAGVSILGSGDVELSGGATCSTKAMGSGTVTCK